VCECCHPGVTSLPMARCTSCSGTRSKATAIIIWRPRGRRERPLPGALGWAAGRAPGYSKEPGCGAARQRYLRRVVRVRRDHGKVPGTGRGPVIAAWEEKGKIRHGGKVWAESEAAKARASAYPCCLILLTITCVTAVLLGSGRTRRPKM
jgi:hypothetical protein